MLFLSFHHSISFVSSTKVMILFIFSVFLCYILFSFFLHLLTFIQYTDSFVYIAIFFLSLLPVVIYTGISFCSSYGFVIFFWENHFFHIQKILKYEFSSYSSLSFPFQDAVVLHGLWRTECIFQCIYLFVPESCVKQMMISATLCNKSSIISQCSISMSVHWTLSSFCAICYFNRTVPYILDFDSLSCV